MIDYEYEGINRDTLSVRQVWLTSDKGKGLELRGTFTRNNNKVHMEMTFINHSMQALSAFAIQFNKNR